jgi:hypothetical protein
MIICGILLILTAKSLMIGPGVPPAQYLPRLLIPESDIYSVNCSDHNDQQGVKHFTQVGIVRDENYGQFPPLSLYSSYGLFRSEKTNNTLVISVWYFNKEAEFRTAQQSLLAFLKQNGAVDTYDLETDNPDVCLSTDTGSDAVTPGSRGAETIRSTWFTNSSGPGVFLAISRPLISGRDDFFIQYIGEVNSTNPSGNEAEIRDLVTLNNRPYNLKGIIHELT